MGYVSIRRFSPSVHVRFNGSKRGIPTGAVAPADRLKYFQQRSKKGKSALSTPHESAVGSRPDLCPALANFWVMLITEICTKARIDRARGF